MKPIVYEYRTGIEVARVSNERNPSQLELLSARDGSIDLLKLVIIPSKRKDIFGGEEKGPRVEVDEGGAEHAVVIKPQATLRELQKAPELVICPNSFKGLRGSQRRWSGFLRDRQHWKISIV